jgi:hypothetical protein
MCGRSSILGNPKKVEARPPVPFFSDPERHVLCLCAYLYSAGKFSETTEVVCPMDMYGDDQIAIHIDAYVPLGIAGKPIDVTQLASHI